MAGSRETEVLLAADRTEIHHRKLVPGAAGGAPVSHKTDMQIAVDGRTIRCQIEVTGDAGGTAGNL